MCNDGVPSQRQTPQAGAHHAEIGAFLSGLRVYAFRTYVCAWCASEADLLLKYPAAPLPRL